ncbi:tRNA uracil 4-sulfurtransferase ThiI [Alkalimonas collagenimarina]|uniref:tRNA sulfurtransferase n=1 Tax=Alkalimonas collagenimarina TaxID=400390 RepID=A0ABT9GU71_9GAMM|nr:tRNA uracil 4-sulfurtransferase ThiI [Alkalimonas collagenimarina]MDP4534602.1 tRNA uracil 4-sulfurtransferase ThiI [Alkalimonas collagenimarina]
MLEFIIKLHSEITIKSKSVRKRQTKLLQQNLKTILLQIDDSISIDSHWDHLTVRLEHSTDRVHQKIVERLACIPGIAQYAEMQSSSFISLDDIFQQVLPVFQQQLQGKTFCVRVRRTGNHDFSSTEAERYIGGGLNQHIPTATVRLKNPQVTVQLEIRGERLIMVRALYRGMGGFPLPSQSDVLSLISGGFDSAISSYLMIKKGTRNHFLFFNLGGQAHEAGVREIAYFLWQKYSLSHKVKFISVDFAPVVQQILERSDPGLMGVILKRQMMRAATELAEMLGIPAIVTGESAGQVSSQTLANLNVIDRVSSMLILRPVIAHDKQDIIDIARAIGVEDMAASMPEYCGVISKKPTVKAILADVEASEQRFDAEVLASVVRDAKIMDIRTIDYQSSQQVNTIDAVNAMPVDAVVLDIRKPDEIELAPLQVDDHAVIELPFYRLASEFGRLPQDKPYYLFCEQGVMSRMQALLLQEQGFKQVGVYQKPAS